MNIATTAGPPAVLPNPPEGVDGIARPAPDPAVDGVDTAVSSDGMPIAENFRQLLTRTMVDGRDKSRDAQGRNAPGDEVGIAVDGAAVGSTDGTAVVSAAGPDAGSAVDAAVAVAVDAAADAAVVRARDTAGDRTIGDDLAAQLALLSQWASAAQIPAPSGLAASNSSDLRATLASGRRSADARGEALDPANASMATGAIDRSMAPASAPASADDYLNEDHVAAARIVDTAIDRASVRGAQSGIRVADTHGSVETALQDPLGLRAVAGTARDVGAANDFINDLANERTSERASTSQPTGTQDWSNAGALNAVADRSIAQTNPSTTSTPPPTLPDALRQMVGTPAWSHEVGEATIRMAANALQTAAIRLNPEHLGPLDVEVRIENGVAHLAFHAAHAETRQALEASRPVLEHLFSAQGMTIGDCAVGDSSPRNDAPSASFDPGSDHANASRQDGERDLAHRAAQRLDDGEADRARTIRLTRSLGMVDTFA